MEGILQALAHVDQYSGSGMTAFEHGAAALGHVLQGGAGICGVHAGTTAPRPLRAPAEAGHQRPRQVQRFCKAPKAPKLTPQAVLSAASQGIPSHTSHCTQPRYPIPARCLLPSTS